MINKSPALVKQPSIGSCLLISFFSFVVCFCLFRWWLLYEPESPFNIAKGNAIIAAINSGRLSEDVKGQVILPVDLSYGFESNFIYLTRNKSGLLLVYFPTAESRSGTRGYIFCSRELNKNDLDQEFIDPPHIRLRTQFNWPEDELAPHPLTEKITSHWYRSITEGIS